MVASNYSSPSDSDYSSSTGCSKRRRKIRNGEEKSLDVDLDRISVLPNPLLHHILSFLPTKQAARTSALSKKWKYLWTSTPVLDFHDSRDIRIYKASNQKLNSFVSFINRSLILNRSQKIEKFRVHLDYKKAFASDVDVWISFATLKNVKELDLNFSPSKVHHPNYYSCTDDDDDDNDYNGDDSGRYLLPMNMFSDNSSLTTLKLKNCDINHGRLINWKSLKVLFLSRMYLNDDFVTEMLSGCPSLELLELHLCWNYEYLNLKSERLRKLVITEREETLAPGGDILVTKISAPHLQSLDISGFFFEYRFINLSSLVDAKLNFDESSSLALNRSHDTYTTYTKRLVHLLDKLRHVKGLSMGSWCLQVLSMLREKALPRPLSSWVCLRVDTSLSKREIPGIVRLLAHTPLLETLVINVTSNRLDSVHLEPQFLKSYDLGEENYWSSQKSSFALALLHLKAVRIVDFVATKTEVELLLFLLKNASMLEKMTIHARNSTSVSLKKTVDATQMLLTFPRCSPKAVVLFA